MKTTSPCCACSCDSEVSGAYRSGRRRSKRIEIMSDLGKSWTPKARAAIGAVVLLALAASLLFPFLGRPIWFDEAVTIMNFVLDPYPDIYLNYTIPNNHIAFSYMLRVWLDSAGYFLPVCEMAFRLPAALTSLALIGLSFHFWRKRMGFHAAFASVACLAVSMPFAIYGTAIRGYALSMLLVALGLEAFLRWEEKGGWFRGALFFSLALAGVAAIPSNALAFAIIALLPTPKARRVFESMAENGWKGKEPARFAGVRIQAAGAAIVAFILFYAPLWNALRRALVHNNGWLRPWAACGHLATGFLVSFWPPLLFALMAGLLSRRRRTSPVVLMGALVFLIPLLSVLARRPAPFPRVFLQMWPIWIYLAGRGAGRFFATCRRKGGSVSAVFAALVFVVVAGGFAVRCENARLGVVFTPKGSKDDFFQPYYMRPDFEPSRVVDRLLSLTRRRPRMVFLSQNADFPSIIFYGKLKGVGEDFWLCDFPGKKHIERLDTSAGGKLFLVARNETDAAMLAERFGLSNLQAVDRVGVQKIYSAEVARRK